MGPGEVCFELSGMESVDVVYNNKQACHIIFIVFKIFSINVLLLSKIYFKKPVFHVLPGS